MSKSNLKLIIAPFILIVAFTLLSGCSKKDSTEKQNDKQQVTDSKEQNMQKSDDKNAEHVMIKLPTMQCKTCKKNIEKAVNKVPGIINVNVEVSEKVAHINYDKTKTDIGKIENAITMAGYDANDKKADQTAYENLDDCCKLPKDQKENSKH
jgi:copper chaperone CopZ